MAKQIYKKVTKAEACRMIAAQSQDFVYVSTIDYDSGENETDFKIIDKSKGTLMVNEAKTIFFIGDEVSHLDLHSTVQNNICNIQRKGKMHSVLLLPFEYLNV